VGLAGLLAWLVGGMALEALHALKLSAYLEDPVRRLMWTLAHAHGTLLSIAAIVLGAVALPRSGASARDQRRSDRLFAAGSVLLPLGFFLGGLRHPEGDPGLGILLVPVGALACAAGLAIPLIALARRRRGPASHAE
jgi:hypothetical protein